MIDLVIALHLFLAGDRMYTMSWMESDKNMTRLNTRLRRGVEIIMLLAWVVNYLGKVEPDSRVVIPIVWVNS